MDKMDQQPLISVVIPCLNREQFLVPTIESILQQDYSPIECIVVDGGSTDGTLDILKKYGDQIQWISEPDDGHADAINKGWQMSQGDILAWLNADDTWVAPNAASQAIAYLQAHPEVDVVYGNCEAVDIEGDFLAMSYVCEWDLEHAVEHCDYCIPQPTSFMRRRILEQVGWLDAGFISKKDHELWLRIGLEGVIHYLPTLLARERIGPGYLAARGDITAEACVALTKKFFTLPNVPERLRQKERRALSNSYLEGMKWAFECGRHWKTIFIYALRAALVDPSNKGNAFQRLKFYVAFDAKGDTKLQWALRGLESLGWAKQMLRRVKN